MSETCQKCKKPIRWTDEMAEDCWNREHPSLKLCQSCAVGVGMWLAIAEQVAASADPKQTLSEWIERYE